ncbi:cysteine dioxygenase family protein [Kribbella sp. NBC_01505]|uniref:cysteine dioxygenase family protein n=1 Tax=Kribbella sp. NBC_01505 TaxID=2903580 RepID=UPI0038658FB9
MQSELDDLYAVVRGVTRIPADWQTVVDALIPALAGKVPAAPVVLRQVPAPARGGDDRSHVLHVEPDGSYSVVALISRPGQATSIHDHTTWCVVAVVAGVECEERFRLTDDGRALFPMETRNDPPGTVSGFAPPGDIHRVTNAGTSVGISLHIYGTDICRIGNSVRRTYDLPIVPPGKKTRS